MVIADAIALSRSCLILGENQHPASLDQPTMSRTANAPIGSRSPWADRSIQVRPGNQDLDTERAMVHADAGRRSAYRSSKAALNALTACYACALAVERHQGQRAGTWSAPHRSQRHRRRQRR